ncbi:hypothetical protein EXS62_02840 [Candidatus Kaiserbacteria bacterium]|nr:hypothetical protein [Candidatus Kaiserbacteria bacterium]
MYVNRLLIALVIAAGLTTPTAAYALGVPFGGRVTAVWPCFNGGMYEVVVGPKGGAFVWTPFSLTYLNYQIRPGVSQLGVADVPYGCVVGFTPTTPPIPIVWFGLRVQIIGTSLAI